MTYKISPGVYPREIDLTERPSPFATSIGAVVFASKKGPLDPTFVSDRVRFMDLYGSPDPTISYGHDCALAFIDESRQLWCKRAIGNGAAYSLGLFANNWYSAGVYDGTSYTSVPGAVNDADNLSRQVQDLVFAGALITANSIGLSVNNSAITPVVFTTSNNNTLALLAQAIQTKLDGVAAGGKAYVVERITGGAANQRIIRIISPEDTTITITNISVTSGVSQTTGQIRDAEWLFFVEAENPGVWADGLVPKIENLDVGVNARVKLTFSAALVTSNTFNGTINSVAIGPVNYATSNNNTLSLIAAAIQAALPGSTATVVDTGTANNRQILIIAPDSLTDITLDSLAVTGGASQATVSYATVVTRVARDKTFDLAIYEGTPPTTVPANASERWKVMLGEALDGLGNQLEIDYAVNDGPRKSIRVRTVRNQALTDDQNFPLNNVTSANFLDGGDDGNTVTSQQIVTGWNDFADPENVAVRILINAGYTQPEVQQKMASIAESRHDCFAVLDMPSDAQLTQDAMDYRMNELNIDSSYAAIYTPDILIFDEFTGKRRYIPPSGLVAAQYAYTDRVAHEWFAPAGLNRGLVKKALDVRVRYNEGDRDALSVKQINTIRKMGPRFPIWGDYTLQYKTSALQSVPARRLLITIEVSLTDALAYSVFEPNDSFTWRRMAQLCEDFLLPIQQARGIRDFSVVSDDRNNTPPEIDARIAHVDLYLKIILPILFIDLKMILTKTGSSFEELITANTVAA